MVVNTVLRKRYRVLRSLGSGAFGDTYLAEDLDLPSHPKCVVKHLRPKTPEADVLMIARRLFESEAATLYRLGNLSTQIPKLFAHFEENGEFYLVQEFIDGHDLSAEIIPGNRWSESQVVQLLQAILEVLAVVHQQNIIHRDLKPQNLMRRREDGKIVLIDFGAVKEIKGLVVNTQGQVTSTIVIGSNGYMPNEQANSKPKLCSDIYAVGIIGIQALTGKLPQSFQEDPTSGEIIWRHEANVSNKLADILTKMVRYHFSQRYQTASEALQALKLLPSVTPSFSLPIVTLKKLAFIQKRWIIVGAGASLLIGVGLLWMITLQQSIPYIPEIKLVCPETSILPLPSAADWENNTTKYYGVSKNSLRSKGTVVLPDHQTGGLARYDGELENKLFHGCGTYQYANGDRYVGQFNDGNFHGVGKLIRTNGIQYQGEFKNNKFHGQGIYTYQNGDRYIGEFNNGKFYGTGKLICHNGNQYQGQFKNNSICQ
ncbi:MAG: protein kinase [Nostocales cyanobacterium 94392]|nr:protein kinase [Nostocales cyanobacterium 94392]